ncbi:3-dehydroquinate synthase [Peribacillus sp. B-H-3]|jgi:3-dehydroquinate synthase|uniref:3-dehydroquinate synthase n=1 Tax=Peribacillus sp. B-H-3 TaxID=3400420 RepID=UPI003B01396D
MDRIDIKTSSKNYPVFIGEGVIANLPEFIEEHAAGANKILIITDEKVAGLHLDKVKSTLSNTGKDVLSILVPEGEFAKTFEVFLECQTFALENNLNRKSLILALGGGAVGDLAGFVASTFMRGIPFIQLPTTLLAHDSAVGGKTAINHPEGKNMIGTFYQPEAVFYDLDFLTTLPLKEVRSGFAEVIKHALIADGNFYHWLKENITDLRFISSGQYQTVIKKGINIKASIVGLDEKETGVRAYLNFGHTLGHGVEKLMGYGNFTHGESVLIGMVFALYLSKKYKNLQFDEMEFLRWVKKLGYQTDIPKQLDKKPLVELMKKDKKTVSENLTFVLLNEIGSPLLADMPASVILADLDSMYTSK